MKVDIEEIIRRLDAKANSVYYDGESIVDLISRVKEEMSNREIFSSILDDMETAMDMIMDWKNGDYTNLSKDTVIIVIVGILYLLDPLDIVPGFLKKGFLDDFIVIIYLLKRIKDELDLYREWRGTQLYSGTN